MDDLDLRRMFDQIAPTQEQEVTMLDRLHRTEREEQTMKRGMKRGLVALVAAALMMTAAFAVAAGLDQRLMDYFGQWRSSSCCLTATAARSWRI